MGKRSRYNSTTRLRPKGASATTHRGQAGLIAHSIVDAHYVVHQLFDSPQSRDKFQLPRQIESVRIENYTLVIVTR